VTSRPQDVVAAGYDAIADRYAGWQESIAGDPRRRYVGRLLELLPAEAEILEIGCGQGVEPTPTLARRGRLTAIDVSRAQLERARAAVPEAELVHGDVTEAEFAAESFDAVVALYSLTHVPGALLSDLFARVAAWLRPGGLLLATLGSRESEETVQDWLGAPMFFSGFEPETNEGLLREAGFELLESRVESMREPESEPGHGPETVAFHWVLVRRRG
jgi:cyclopropane fatty-acyl-phospholipid synthase-like methyltransferase